MSLSLASKVFAVTGGASGMGAATCRLLAHKGASTVSIGDINPKTFGSLRQELKEINPKIQVQTTELNVMDPEKVDRWVEGIVSEFGDLHGAANVAGIPQPVGVRQSPNIVGETNEMWKKIMGVNLDGIFYCNRAQVRSMISLSSAPRSIVNIASLAAFRHTPDVFAYGVSKAACSFLSTCVANDVQNHNIRVNTVSPGKFSRIFEMVDFNLLIAATNTPMLPQFVPNASTSEAVVAEMASRGVSMLEPADIASAIVWLLSEESGKVSGANIPVGYGIP